MKRMMVIIIMVVLIQCTVFTPVYASQLYEDMTYKLGRGLTNIVTSPLEFGETIEVEIEEGGVYKGICYGVLKGFIKGVARASVGVYEVITFPVGIPEGYKPILEPEFVFVPETY